MTRRKANHPYKRRDRIVREASGKRLYPLSPYHRWTIKVYDAYGYRLAIRTLRSATTQEAEAYAVSLLNTNANYHKAWIVRHG